MKDIRSMVCILDQISCTNTLPNVASVLGEIFQHIPCFDNSQSPPAERSATLSAGALLSSIGKFPGVT